MSDPGYSNEDGRELEYKWQQYGNSFLSPFSSSTSKAGFTNT